MKGGVLGLPTGGGGQVLRDELFNRVENNHRPSEHFPRRTQCVAEGDEGYVVTCALTTPDAVCHGLRWGARELSS